MPVQSNLFYTSVYPYGYRDALFVLLVIFYTFIKQHNRKNSAKSVCYVKTAGICWLYCQLTCNISKGKESSQCIWHIVSTSKDRREQINSCSMLETRLHVGVKISHADVFFHRSLFKDFSGKYSNQNVWTLKPFGVHVCCILCLHW